MKYYVKNLCKDWLLYNIFNISKIYFTYIVSGDFIQKNKKREIKIILLSHNEKF